MKNVSHVRGTIMPNPIPPIPPVDPDDIIDLLKKILRW